MEINLFKKQFQIEENYTLQNIIDDEEEIKFKKGPIYM